MLTNLSSQRQSNIHLLFEEEINREDKKEGADGVIQSQCLLFKKDQGEDHKDDKCDSFLEDLELHEIERAAVLLVADTISWDLGGIFR